MRGNTIGKLIFVVLLAVTSCATLSAGIIGSFTFGGNITATTTTITWTNTDPGTTAEQATVGTPSSGIFSGLANGDLIGIANLSSTAEPSSNPDATFAPPVSFITFPGVPGLESLLINQVFHGINGVAVCTASPAAAGQQCTVSGVNPPAGSQSPFNFANNPGVEVPQSTATFAFSGVTADGNIWQANFSSQFNVPFQDVLATLAGPAGQVTNTFSATVTEFSGPGVPEPGSMALMGLGLGLVVLSAGLRRKLSRRP